MRMKNFLFFLGAIFSLSLTSCSSTSTEETPQPEQVSIEVKQEIKQGVVHRLFQRNHKSWTDFSARLMDGTIIAGYTIDDRGISQSQLADFFFVQPGDTIVYSGEKVLEVKFKD